MSLPEVMAAAVLTGHGGLDKLDYRTDVPVPRPGEGEVLIEVAAAAVNNTDINTRIGWYSKSVESGTEAGGTDGFSNLATADAAWSGNAMVFPRIQGADVCGRIAAVGAGVSAERIGQRVLVRNMLRSYVGYRPFECWTLGAECDGGFAQFTVAPDRETHTVNTDWSDAELAAVPCAYSTAENMLHRAGVGAERVLVTGASGGVGLAAVQLAKRRGATVLAICSPAKAAQVIAGGAQQTFDRGADLVGLLGQNSLDVVIDVVGGAQTAQLLELLRSGGRYVIAGAIGGPHATIDLRTIYLKDLSLLGCTFQDDVVFENLIGYIERNEFRPVVSKTYPLAAIASAQQDFLSKQHAGKIVLLPPAVTEPTGR
ncbi:MAG: alcohol dehydrogenase family protein [Microbacteriaceae bacterium]